jgi:hypothetical protein
LEKSGYFVALKTNFLVNDNINDMGDINEYEENIDDIQDEDVLEDVE